MTAATSSADLRKNLTDQLAAAGHLSDPRWSRAFRAVPREAFVNQFTIPTREGRFLAHNLGDPDRARDALAAVYSDNSLLTQFDAGGTAVSSSTAPSLMALMLHQLDVTEGHTILEIGTGTGYNAALLCHVLGDDAVTTVDIHPELVAAAQHSLHSTGYRPHIAVCDGREGYPDRAPYDRIIATCGLDRVPASWLRQVRPGGKILVNLSFALVLLTVSIDGSASGRFGTTAAFMQIRDDPADVACTTADVLGLTTDTGSQLTRSATWVGQVSSEQAAFLRALVMPSVQVVTRQIADGCDLLLADPPSGSWARVHHTTHSTVLTEHGPRHLYDELVTLVAEWDQHGRPTPEQYGLTITSEGHHLLWLHQPDHPVTVL